MCFVFCLLASLVFWATYFGLENETHRQQNDVWAVLVALHTVPSALLIFEYPFNMIPWDWRFVPFDLCVMGLYLADTLIFQAV